MNKLPEYLGYVVLDTKYNRQWYPSLIGRGFAAPANYVNALPYRKIKTQGFVAEDSVRVVGIVEPQPPVVREYSRPKLSLPK